MRLVVITNEELKEELLATANPADVFYTTSIEEAIQYKNADAIIDLLFINSEDRIKMLASCLPKLIIVNCVEYATNDIHPSFIRINGWPTLLGSSLIEVAGDPEDVSKIEYIFKCFGKSVEWTEDQPGFISSRIISCIIREAKYAFEEGISSKEDIDNAMKLGTSYPYGPFEWYEKIGTDRVDALLDKLSK